MKIYLAAQYSWREHIKECARELEALGFTVTSSWLRERKDPQTDLGELDGRFLREHAEADERDIQAADCVISFTVAPTKRTKRGGRHVEFGLGRALGKLMVVCGPKENIFHSLQGVRQFDNFEMVKEFLISERERRRGK